MRLFDELGEDSLPGLRPFQAKADQISALPGQGRSDFRIYRRQNPIHEAHLGTFVPEQHRLRVIVFSAFPVR